MQARCSGHAARRGTVTGLAFHPSADQAVTTGEEGTFRVWARAAAPARGRGAAAGAGAGAGAAGAPAPKGHWLCRSVGSYRDAPMTAAAFSADGSLVAVAAADTVCCGPGLSSGRCWQCMGLHAPTDFSLCFGLLAWIVQSCDRVHREALGLGHGDSAGQEQSGCILACVLRRLPAACKAKFKEASSSPCMMQHWIEG